MRRPRTALLLGPLFLVGALSACSTYPAAPLDTAQVLQDLRATRVELPKAGLTADDAVALALVHNPWLRAWRHDAAIAAGLVVTRSAEDDPELRVSLSDLYSRVRAPLLYAIELRFFPALPGELDAKRRRLEARERRVLARVATREAEVARVTRDAHAGLVLIDSELSSVQSAVELHARLDAMVTQQIAAGVSTRLDQALVALRREELVDELSALGAQRSTAQAQLAALLGTKPNALIQVRDERLSVPEPPPSAIEAEELALSRRADLRALAEVHAQREQDVRLRHLARLPWPRHVQAGYSGLPTDTGLDMDLAIELPNAGLTQTRIDIAGARRDKAQHEYRARLHEVRSEIRIALLALREQTRRRRHLSNRLEPVLREAEDLVRATLDGGATDVVALVAIQGRVLAARRARARALHDYEVARTRLAAATGTLLDESVADAATQKSSASASARMR